jgi:hypothetical protein
VGLGRLRLGLGHTLGHAIKRETPVSADQGKRRSVVSCAGKVEELPVELESKGEGNRPCGAGGAEREHPLEGFRPRQQKK